MLNDQYLNAFEIKDDAESNLVSGLSASSSSAVLTTGHGARFPTTYNGTATSGGTGTALNSTAIGASGVAVGDIIRNITDGSVAVIRTVSTNAITTTQLQGGAGNTWDNADVWAVGSFVVTLVQYNTTNDPDTGVDHKEKVLVNWRVTDTLFFNASGRGYDGSTAASFDSNDNVYLYAKQVELKGILGGVIDHQARIEDLEEDVAGNVLLKDGSIPLDNNAAFKARNNANNANISLFKLTTADIFEFQTLPRNPSSRSISNDYDVIDKKYFTDNLPGQITKVAGEAITVSGDPVPVYISDGTGGRTAGRFYRADANDYTNFATVSIFFLKTTVAAPGDSALLYSGVVSGFTGLTAGRPYFLQDTIGTLGLTPGTTVICVGRSVSTTEIDTNSKDMKVMMGVFTSVATQTAGNNDETVNVGFRPVYVEVEYYIRGRNGATTTTSQRHGFVRYKETAIVSHSQIGSTDGGGGATITAVAISNPAATSAPTAGGTSSGSGKMDPAMVSVSQLGFVYRKQVSINSPSEDVYFRGNFKAYGY